MASDTPATLADKIFKKYDKDGSGSIDGPEFQFLLYEFEHAVTAQEAGLAFGILDRNGNGTIDISEFKRWWSEPNRWEMIKVDPDTLEIRKAAAKVFATFDRNRNGQIDTNEFPAFYNYLLRENLTTKDMRRCLQDLDTNLDGKIQYVEYVEWLYRCLTEERVALAGLADPAAVEAQRRAAEQQMLQAQLAQRGRPPLSNVIVNPPANASPQDLIKAKKKKDKDCCIQ